MNKKVDETLTIKNKKRRKTINELGNSQSELSK